MTNQTAATRAPKGGISIMGTFYKGGQFLPQYAPCDNESKANNSNRSKYLNSQVAKAVSNNFKLYRGDRVVADKNGFKTIKRGLWYRMNIGCA